jgi:hypothetical protein
VYEYAHFREQFLRYHFGWLIFSASVLNDFSSGTLTFAEFLSKTLRNVYSFFRDAHVWLVLAVAGLVLMRLTRTGSDCRAIMNKDHWSLLALWFLVPTAALTMAGGFKHPGIRKLATKVRMLDLEPNMKVVQFPATKEIAAQYGMQTGFFSYFSIALPWLFYSDHPLFEAV